MKVALRIGRPLDEVMKYDGATLATIIEEAKGDGAG